MGQLSQEELQALLAGVEECKLACLDADGGPYVVPIVIYYQDEGFYITARERSAWRKFLQQDGRVCLSLERGEQRAQVKGYAELIEGPVMGTGKVLGLWVERAKRQGWIDDPNFQDYRDKLFKYEPMYGFFVRPLKIVSWEGGDWAKRYKHADW